MHRTHRILATLAVGALLLGACGDDDTSVADPTGGTVADAGDEGTAPADDDTTDDTAGDTGGDDEVADGPSGVEHPVVRFAAHGPGEPNTFGPACSMGIEDTAISVFRVTAPATWDQRGSGGGSGSSELTFEVGGEEVTLHLASSTNEVQLFGDVTFGAEVGTADLAGESVPIVEAEVGEASTASQPPSG